MTRLRSIQEHLNRLRLLHVSLAVVDLVGGYLLAAASIPHHRSGMPE